MGLHRGGVARQFVLQIAARSTVVFRQHRFPPYSSFEFAHSQLQPGKMPQGRPIVSACETDHVFLQLQVVDLPALGRKGTAPRRLSPSEKSSEAQTLTGDGVGCRAETVTASVVIKIRVADRCDLTYFNMLWSPNLLLTSLSFCII